MGEIAPTSGQQAVAAAVERLAHAVEHLAEVQSKPRPRHKLTRREERQRLLADFPGYNQPKGRVQ